MNLSGRKLGEYVLLEKVGAGGFATVYRGEQLVLKREVAVKVLHMNRSASDVEQKRFLLEAQLTSQVKHSDTTHIYSYGVEPDGVAWIAMRWIPGVTLRSHLKTHGPMLLEKLVPLLERIAQVLADAHEQGIVHRDLKPENVMVTVRDDEILATLLDFGIAKGPPGAPWLPWPGGSLGEGTAPIETRAIRAAADTNTDSDPAASVPAGRRRLTWPGMVMGSWPYMSPEQWSNPSAVGPASDIYSLAVVAYEVLAGRRPFTGRTRNEYRRQHLKAEVPALGGDLADIDRILRRGLAKLPSDRPGSVLEFVAELRAGLAACPRQQLRASAQQWAAGGRARGLLWGRDVLARFERWALRARTLVLGELESNFIAASRNRAQRMIWLWRALGALTVAAVLCLVLYRSEKNARIAEAQAQILQNEVRIAQDQARMSQQQARSAEQLVTQAETEQGRQAIHDDMPEARAHLAIAYSRDQSSPEVEFMFARSLEPQLAELAVFPAIGGRMWSASFDPTGHRIVTTDDQGAVVWDAANHQRLFTLTHSGDTVYDATYTPNGNLIVTAGGDGTVGIWDAVTGAPVRSLHGRAKKPRYYLVAVTPDGKRIAALDAGGEAIHVWDASTGAMLADLPNGGSLYPGLVFSPDGRWLASIGPDVAHIFDTRTWAPVRTMPNVHHFAFDATGTRLITGNLRGDASIWDIATGKRTRHLREVGDSVERVAFSPDGKLAATASFDGAEQIWLVSSGALQSQLNARHTKPLSLEFDKTSKRLLAAGADGSVVVADVTLGMPVAALEGPDSLVRVAHFDQDASHVVGASWDGTARLWDAHPSYLRWSVPGANSDCRSSPELDRRFVAIACEGLPTRIWDTATQSMVAQLPAVTPIEGDERFAFPAVSEAGDLAAIAHGNTVEIYELPGARRVGLVSHDAAVSAVAFAGRGHDLVSGDVYGRVLLTHDGARSLAMPDAPSGVDAVGFDPDGRIVVAYDDRQLRVFASEHATILTTLVAPNRVMSLRFSSDGRRLITLPKRRGSANGKPTQPALWDLEHYQLVRELEGHRGQVFGARFLDDDEILSAGSDGTARLWGADGRLNRTYRGSHSVAVSDAVLSPDRNFVVGGCGDSALHVWSKESGRQVWTLPVHRSSVMGLHWEGNDIVTRSFSGEISRWAIADPRSVIATATKPANVSK
ncbi:MAG TPA: protein kinase [Kofleriaceae bacterium]|nr:protein kinase [Kofleriaceae bacterium]